MSDEQAKHRRSTFIKWSVVLTWVGAVAWIVLPNLLSTATTEASESAVEKKQVSTDTRAFSAQLALPGHDCSYAGAIGWGKLPSPPQDPDVLTKTVRKTRSFSGWGPVDLKFRLPKAADGTVIEIDNVEVEVGKVTTSRPAWEIQSSECGGGESSSNYEVTFVDGTQKTIRLNTADGDSSKSDQLFQRWQIEPGKPEFFRYDVRVCDMRTYDFRFQITYSGDSARPQTLVLPADGWITVTGFTGRQRSNWADPIWRPADLEFSGSMSDTGVYCPPTLSLPDL